MMGYLDTEMIDCIRTKQSDDKFVLCVLKVRNDFMINNLNEELTELGGQAHFLQYKHRDIMACVKLNIYTTILRYYI